jgi:hypothetical protein
LHHSWEGPSWRHREKRGGGGGSRGLGGSLIHVAAILS